MPVLKHFRRGGITRGKQSAAGMEIPCKVVLNNLLTNRKNSSKKTFVNDPKFAKFINLFFHNIRYIAICY